MVGVDYEPDNHETDECGKHGDKCTLVGGAAQGVLKSEQNGREDHHDIDAAANPARVEQDVEIDVVGVFGVDVRRELQRADAQWIFEDDPECDELAGEAAVVGGIVGLQDLCAQLEKFANFGNLQIMALMTNMSAATTRASEIANVICSRWVGAVAKMSAP